MRIYLLFVLAFLLVGCRLDMGVVIDVNNDASGTLALSIMTDSELERAAESAGVDPLGRMVERVESSDSSWVVDHALDEATGEPSVTLSIDFADPAEFDARYEELRAALDAPEARLLGPLELSVDPETEAISLVGSLPLEVSEVAAVDLGTDIADLGSQLTGVVSSTLELRTPGPVVEAADLTSASSQALGDVPLTGPFPDEPLTLTWVTDAPGSVTPVSATFEPGGRDVARLVVLVVLGLVLVAGMGASIVLRRRR